MSSTCECYLDFQCHSASLPTLAPCCGHGVNIWTPPQKQTDGPRLLLGSLSHCPMTPFGRDNRAAAGHPFITEGHYASLATSLGEKEIQLSNLAIERKSREITRISLIRCAGQSQTLSECVGCGESVKATFFFSPFVFAPASPDVTKSSLEMRSSCCGSLSHYFISLSPEGCKGADSLCSYLGT